MMTWRKPTAKALQMAPHWLSEPRFAGGELAMDAPQGHPRLEYDAAGAAALLPERSLLHLSALLPPETAAAASAEPVLEFVRSAIGDDFALAAGWGGYAILGTSRWDRSSESPSTSSARGSGDIPASATATISPSMTGVHGIATPAG